MENSKDHKAAAEPPLDCLVGKDKPWRDYPIGTKAHSILGGHWLRTERGWQWQNGSTFPTPGADAFGRCIELPNAPGKPTAANEPNEGENA